MMKDKQHFYSNGKLLVTSEYLVLDGATALALPTKFGQYLFVKKTDNNEKILLWKSITFDNITWFKATFIITTLEIISTSNISIGNTLQKILLEVKKSNPDFLNSDNSLEVTTHLDFNTKWGLGTSSTLINNIANWAKIDAFKLQFNIFGGSGYDIASAQNNNPILYQIKNDSPKIKTIKFNPPFKDQLFFIYLNQKQNSRDGIKTYKKFKGNKITLIDAISQITTKISQEKSLKEFEKLIKKHENIIAKIIGIKPIQERLFLDYFGQIKSLGAWGGDFILATGNDNTKAYFNKKGYGTVINYRDIIL